MLPMKKSKLKKRVDELEKLLKQKDTVIELLQLQLDTLKNQTTPYFPTYYDNINLDKCVDGGEHDYPSPWHGVIAPHCKKCGKQGQMLEITFNGHDSGTKIDFDLFGGNMVYTDFNTFSNKTQFLS